ncbi:MULTISPECIES: DUF389 domain-containing protein [unclassified Novosphingobium]|uniref:DUF389 domain-containing protein n=1 Tax=unclassified Novosphingobium TaxID=2644732 RepID=UPI00149411EF|nr:MULTISPECIES: DUF389 domain-containing protein [unclassified Novosphingobium]MBB3358010.1 putative hydrophobic protein (TIGR00271 family) [Novosphingobium sp. BK256]MBB3374371.1 putative hydrophobic protein (TIGR00271 family) [Novosphingobium sp. BK280]MBB3378783.1 putative hydrophobic protein (TIGR00271 family) [Novosphingobium sp. BK258]MBB3420477.1 putative hydrophobic protein (TIGR00271 family) [Novosphingobium sp. BK267]MBB3448401.1 putative hydrophobic protein (TIGR00271 family) [Novo
MEALTEPARNTGMRVGARLSRLALYRWWRRRVVGQVDHQAVVARIFAESCWSPRYAFMTMMSAGIAMLGLLLSSPAVVIGAMLISPLMSPILGFGFSLALFDFAEMRRSLLALAVGAVAAVAFTALIVTASPLQAPTAEVVARTRPNLFDLGVALFAALAGSFAIIRGRGETIVGVAIATALMPPLAVVGYGLATWNLPVLGGALALFVTNFITIALSATAMARYYGFGHQLSSRQSWTQTILLLLVFVAMAVPLGLALNRIAREALIVSEVRSLLNKRFGSASRVTQLDVAFDREPNVIRAVVITPRGQTQKTVVLQKAIEQELGRPVRLNIDQILLEPGAGAIEAQREELRQAGDQPDLETQRLAGIARMIALITGVSADDVTIDRDHHRATAAAVPLPGATVATYRVLEARAAAQTDGWSVAIVPPQGPLPEIAFANDADTLDPVAREAVLVSAWAARRWNVPALGVPGLPAGTTPARPSLAQRRALAIAATLATQGVNALPAPGGGQRFHLSTGDGQ